ncbi:hypothetical protein FH972_004230 [Carpinus fangiana]|uniref:Uncharacterized protein n=1 Tax=Carpinus fangiana TaxID=176857 RepID=A0A5N6QKX1_9ROSI|nr:hypothetical protein FH972_004230 [Carpinus fangiana]
MSDREVSDLEAPEELTADQAKEQHEDIKKIERENKARFVWFLFSLSSSPSPNGAFIYLVKAMLLKIAVTVRFFMIFLLKRDVRTRESIVTLMVICYNLVFKGRTRVVREKKERRRLWAQKLTPRPSRKGESIQDAVEDEMQKESVGNEGMLPDDIVKVIAAREKKVFLSDSEDEKPEEKPTKRKKKPKTLGVETIILKEMRPAHCLQNSLEFLKKRKMEVSRSSAVLTNSNQALRLLSNSGLINKK